MSTENAVAILRENSGSQFDSEILDLFLELLDRGDMDSAEVPHETELRQESPVQSLWVP
jgi:HD-GYP domain-containing protein (c-di-GMP phosphodiesterase class II)